MLLYWIIYWTEQELENRPEFHSLLQAKQKQVKIVGLCCASYSILLHYTIRLQINTYKKHFLLVSNNKNEGSSTMKD